MSNLCKERPRIDDFFQIAEGIIHKRFIPAKSHGRASNAFTYILEGECVYSFSEKTFVAKMGDILFLAKDSIYSMDIKSENYRFIFADFSFSEKAPCDCEVFEMQNSRGTESAFRRMLEKWRQKRPAVKEDCLAMLYSIYADIIRNESAAYIPNSKRAKLDAALQYISEHFADETLSVEKAAKTADLSESHFRRLFKEAYRISPIKYINLMRIERAKELIKYTNESFSQIAEKTGFANVYYFSRIFKKEVGCTPSEYREEYSEYQKI
ncbi:MAG: helix-turn-helix transcriptional regulator [Clostridia bacterium]|nr:helix-turn-helix transcriptional regulator [Clostridia bacterium]